MSHNKGIGIRIDFVDIIVHDGPFSNNIPPGFQKGCFMFIFMRRVYISTNFEKKKKKSLCSLYNSLTEVLSDFDSYRFTI